MIAAVMAGMVAAGVVLVAIWTFAVLLTGIDEDDLAPSAVAIVLSSVVLAILAIQSAVAVYDLANERKVVSREVERVPTVVPAPLFVPLPVARPEACP